MGISARICPAHQLLATTKNSTAWRFGSSLWVRARSTARCLDRELLRAASERYVVLGEFAAGGGLGFELERAVRMPVGRAAGMLALALAGGLSALRGADATTPTIDCESE